MPIIALLVLSLLWGSTFFFTKIVLPDLHPVSIVFFRCLFGGIALLPFFIWKRDQQEFKKIPILLGIALLNAGVPWILMSYSQQGLDTTISAVLNATGPIFGLLFSILILKVKIRWQELLGVIIGFTGIIISFNLGGGPQVGFQYSSAGLLLIAACFYALSSILITKFLTHVSVFTLSFVTMLVGCIFAGIFMLWVQPSSYQGLGDSKNLLALIILGVFNSGIGNVIFFYLVKSGGPVFALLITFLMPITTIFLGVALLDESLGKGTIIALIFVLSSVYVTQRRGGRRNGNISRSSIHANEE
ncbi:DMT family transporter [Ornithinibacillus halotolerans]|uniref:Permease n=1 Tax=Ornithinibacillus halotolerans TaxID=1274357 RepID=A0A916SCL1_9BACI|nr:DMT family transporter [Ornithinibacillus halotolerans]GGA91335.1 permease [Ornithinibacillus halotolerans]